MIIIIRELHTFSRGERMAESYIEIMIKEMFYFIYNQSVAECCATACKLNDLHNHPQVDENTWHININCNA